MEEKTKNGSGQWKDVLILGFALYYVNMLSNINDRVRIDYPLTELPRKVMSVDINRDGLMDLIQKDGEVLVKQIDGSYISLVEMKQREIDSINAKYTFKPEIVRNSVDNMDYTLNTGRYVLGD